MMFEYNMIGENRKRLVTAISGILGVKSRYTGVPKCNYVVDFVTVNREGNVEVEDTADIEKVNEMVTKLANQGFIAENADQILLTAEPAAAETTATETATAESTPAEQENTDDDVIEKETRAEVGMTISVPRGIFTDIALDNLRKIVRVKSPLLCKAFATDELEIEVSDEAVSFPWFGELTPEDLRVFSQFIERLCKFAISSKRITSKDRRMDNERYAMRTWLIRLGCNGDEYKDLRKKLLAPLSGDAAWRFGRPEKEQEAVG